MPIYCYSHKEDVLERSFPFGKAPEVIRSQGKTYHRDFQAEHVKTRPPGNWPMESDSLGVDPSQIKEAEAESIRLGIPTRFTSDGCAVLESPSHRKRLAEAYGYFDRNGGYSDPQPK